MKVPSSKITVTRWRDFVVLERLSHETALFDPFVLLNADRDVWMMLWRAKGVRSWQLGAGHLFLFKEPPRDLPAGLRLYGGMPFSGTGGPQWQELKEAAWFIPEVEWESHDDGVLVRERILVPAQTDPEEFAREWGGSPLRTDLLALSKAVERLPSVLKATNDIEPDVWMAAVDKAKALMAGGPLRKVVLSRSQTLYFAEPPPTGAIARLLSGIPEESFVFALKTPSNVTFMGRSPERLLAWQDGRVAVDAIAGTRRRDGEGAEGKAMQSSDKDTEEHRWVADFVEAELKRVCESVVCHEREALLQLHHLQHMMTRFSGVMRDDVSPFDLLTALHPTPAVGGVPTAKALEFLGVEEGLDRGWFAGIIGCCDGRGGDFAIGIRSALLWDKQLRLFAGAGIVPDSQPPLEWQETELKMSNFLSLFRLPADIYEHAAHP